MYRFVDIIIRENLRKYSPQQTLKQICFIYVNTEDAGRREIAERVIVRLMREGVRP